MHAPQSPAIAAFLGAGQLQLIAQHVEERPPGFNGKLARFFVYCDLQDLFHVADSNACPSARPVFTLTILRR